MELKNGIKDLLESQNRHLIESELLPNYLKGRRWFASKDQVIRSVRLATACLVEHEAGELLLCELEVELAAKSERYQLPLGVAYSDQDNSPLVEKLKLTDATVRGKLGAITDAFSLDLLPTILLQAIKAGRVITFSDAKINFSSLEGFDSALPKGAMSVKRLSAEQSNSSLVIGATMIVKLIRRVMHGVNPEVEMVRYLTENRYSHTPPLLGEVQYVENSGSFYSMYVVQKFIPNQGDAWAYTLDVLRNGVTAFPSYSKFVAAIGNSLAQLHEVLARPTTAPAFQPREATEADVTDWTDSATNQLEAAFTALENVTKLEVRAAHDKDFLLAHHQQILATIRLLAKAGIGSLLTRIHGDFHLGQVLVADGNAYIIDFEGEPSKPLETRRAKSSPMRDVAGLLRSIDYAGAISATFNESFVPLMSGEFLQSYQAVLHSSTKPWINEGIQQTRLLDLFLLEKSAYEICYEAANRPEWITIPLRGLAEIVRRVAGPTETIHA